MFRTTNQYWGQMNSEMEFWMARLGLFWGPLTMGGVMPFLYLRPGHHSKTDLQIVEPAIVRRIFAVSFYKQLIQESALGTIYRSIDRSINQSINHSNLLQTSSNALPLWVAMVSQLEPSSAGEFSIAITKP